MKAPRGALKPPDTHVRWLEEAIAALEAADSARDRELRSALGRIDQLSDAVRRIDPTAYPPSFRERLVSARLDLNLGDPEECLVQLKGLKADFEAYWSK